MKIYEAITQNKTEIHCDDLHEDLYLNIEWSYIISLPVWIPIAIVCILLVVFFPKSLFRSFGNIVHRVFRTTEEKTIDDAKVETNPTHCHNISAQSMKTTERACVPTKKILKRPTNICKTNDFSEVFERRSIPVDKVHSILFNACEAHFEFSEAYKYLCTCLPGNRILARKPIRCNRLSTMKMNETIEN